MSLFVAVTPDMNYVETSDEPVTTAEAVQPEAGLDPLLLVPVCTLGH